MNLIKVPEEKIYKNMMKSFTNGITRGFILYTLYKNPMHGYGLVNRINKCFEQPIKSGALKKIPSSKIYPLLSKMEKSGVIYSKNIENRETKKNVKYYKITEKGKEILFSRKKTNKEMLYNPYYKEFTDFMTK